MKLTLTEIAERLQLNSDTLERWIRQGRIPVKRKGDMGVFTEAELIRWAESQRLSFRLVQDENLQDRKPLTPVLTTAMRQGGVHLGIPGSTKVEVLKAMVGRIPGATGLEADMLFGLLMDREQLTSTAVGKGVAIPHPRNPLKDVLATPAILTCFPETPVDFDAIDNVPVFVLFLLLSPSIELHLGLLSRLSFCLRDDEFVEFLKARPSPDSFFENIEALERKLEKNNTGRHI